ncbi:hypothetical protein SAMN04488047_12127 [Tranquillimonas alkanivorans]|uniref:Uncharacterized protein n=1 Tax=Tranquillimonas alkanivorans TaxID=441119 RepID=A0A1I5ULK9_9RHOB|nr:hypothetical protein SAMN04488047_12127 [Tranquillimonas alkanivorans]
MGLYPKLEEVTMTRDVPVAACPLMSGREADALRQGRFRVAAVSVCLSGGEVDEVGDA